MITVAYTIGYFAIAVAVAVCWRRLDLWLGVRARDPSGDRATAVFMGLMWPLILPMTVALAAGFVIVFAGAKAMERIGL